MKNVASPDYHRGFVRTIVLIVIGLFILSYLNIFKVEEYVTFEQIKSLWDSFLAFIKKLFTPS